ncbi:hypothetical protein A2U01_0029572, partial [Trifolium medium]|nr:hypothetical protein [Trifolium medium]
MLMHGTPFERVPVPGTYPYQYQAWASSCMGRIGNGVDAAESPCKTVKSSEIVASAYSRQSVFPEQGFESVPVNII